MTAPVVVSRIQNRRGTQVQFDGYAYSPSGPNSIYPINNVGAGYYPGSADPNFTPANYPNVLLPGELALCTDSGRLFMGNLNGGFVEIQEVSPGSGEFLQATTWILPPVASPGVFQLIEMPLVGSNPPINIPLDWASTPFFTIQYSVTDNPSPDWNVVGTNFSKNGQLRITAVNSATPAPTPSPVPPSPPWSPVTLLDNGVEVNTTTYDVSFKAVYQSGRIQLWYLHNFPYNLTLNTNTTTWITF